MTFRLSVLVGLLGITIACGRESGSPPSDALAPAAPSPITTSAAAPGAAAVARGREEITVNMADACDPDTFNAAIAPGTCTRSGGMKFDRFIDLLTRLAFVGPWHFAPNMAKASVGATFVAVNKGGEVHTFTEVAAFGGGIVAGPQPARAHARCGAGMYSVGAGRLRRAWSGVSRRGGARRRIEIPVLHPSLDATRGASGHSLGQERRFAPPGEPKLPAAVTIGHPTPYSATRASVRGSA